MFEYYQRRKQPTVKFKYNMTMPKSQKAGFYTSTQRFGKPNNFRLQKVLGNGPEILVYQKSENGHLPYYYGEEDRSFRVYGFTVVKNVVTPILDPGADQSIKCWAARVGKEKAEQIRNEAISTGKTLHSMAERWNAGKSLGLYPLDMSSYVEALKDDILPHLNPSSSPIAVVDDNDEVITLSEVFVVDFDRQFLGRLDLVVEIARKPFNGSRVLLELKSSRKEKTQEHMRGGIIQAVAYLTTFNTIALLFPDRVLPLDGVAMAYVYSAGNGQIMPVLGEELEEYVEEWAQWLSCFHDVLNERSAA